MPASKRIATIMMGSAGQFAVFDGAGDQVAELQIRSAVALLAEKAEALGYDLTGCRVETPYRSGSLERSENFGWTIR